MLETLEDSFKVQTVWADREEKGTVEGSQPSKWIAFVSIIIFQILCKSGVCVQQKVWGKRISKTRDE